MNSMIPRIRKNNNTKQIMIRFYKTRTMIKRLLWLMCLCSIIAAFMLCFVFVVPDLHITHTISPSNPITIMATRHQSSLVTGLQSDLVTKRNGNIVTRKHSRFIIGNQSSSVTRHQSRVKDKSFENPSIYLQSYRFDLIVKMVYAYFYAYKEQVPKVVRQAYAEHLRVWNHFKEYCSNNKKTWFDGKIQCKPKRNEFDFVSSFHKTIENIKSRGFNSSMSRIPLDQIGFLLNGAHRLSASVILARNASFEHYSYKQRSYSWGYRFFKRKGMSEKAMNMVMLEWMKIQLNLPCLKTSVFIVSVFSNNGGKDETMRKIVKDRCSKDNGILYEKVINFTKIGMRQLITHMYGQQPWLEAKIQHMLSKFNSTYSAVFIFVYANSNTELRQCKNEIRKLYNDKIFKSTVHIPDMAEENLILAEMILNQNSIQCMNYAKNTPDCKLIAKEVAIRSLIVPIRTLPGIYVGRDDVLIDSGTVLGFFDLRKRTDVDLLFLRDIDKSLLGNRHGIVIQAHAFKNNSISHGRAWGEDHFSDSGAKDQWDLFYDPNNFGYCYGIKFVSLKQLVRYKTKRKEPQKDAADVALIKSFLNATSRNN